MVGLLQIVGNPLPYHLFSYGALLGTEIYQTFINTKLCFKYLSMKEFLTLQKRVFPVYFGSQVGLAALTAATCPPYSVISLGSNPWSAVPLIIVLVTGTLNWIVYGPRTTTASFVRRAIHEAQEKNSDERVEDQEKIHRANRTFSFNHAMSIHLNAISLIATVWYGFSLSSRILDGF